MKKTLIEVIESSKSTNGGLIRIRWDYVTKHMNDMYYNSFSLNSVICKYKRLMRETQHFTCTKTTNA